MNPSPAKPVRPHVLFVSLDSPWINWLFPARGNGPFVLRFESEEAAIEYAFAKLTQARQAWVDDDGIWLVGLKRRYASAEQAVEDWQWRLGSSEYFSE